MYNKAKLAEISALRAGGKINRMNEGEMKAYGAELDSFVEAFPLLESKMKAALEKKDYDGLRERLNEASALLKKINADALSMRCQSQLGEIDGGEHGAIEARLVSFFADVTALSIDIQVAVYESPAVKTEPERRQSSIAAGPVYESDGQKLVLAVDDVAFFLQSLKTHLQGMPFKLVCVTSGDDALRFITNKSPDLYILDIEMPGMNGYELAREIKRHGKDAPVIFLTGNANKEYVLKALEVGATDFIVKPIDKEQVTTRIAKALGITAPGKKG